MTVLLLGDSHTYGAYGKALAALFEQAGAAVDRVGVGGVTAKAFLNGTWAKYKARTGNFNAVKSKPYDLIIISLGTNDAGGISSRAGAAAVAANIKALADSLNGKQVYWVGAPAFNDYAAHHYGEMRARASAYRNFSLNQRAQLVWDAAAPLFGPRAIDPRAATAEAAKPLGNDIHFGADGGRAWAQYVYGVVALGTPRLDSPSVPVAPVPTQDDGAVLVDEPASGRGLLIVGLLAASVWLLTRNRARPRFAYR